MKGEYSFYEYFYCINNLSKEYINKKLSHMEESKYTVIKKLFNNN